MNFYTMLLFNDSYDTAMSMWRRFDISVSFVVPFQKYHILDVSFAVVWPLSRVLSLHLTFLLLLPPSCFQSASTSIGIAFARSRTTACDQFYHEFPEAPRTCCIVSSCLSIVELGNQNLDKGDLVLKNLQCLSRRVMARCRKPKEIITLVPCIKPVPPRHV